MCGMTAWSAPMSQPERKNVPRKGAGGRAAHDVGGLEFGPVDRTEHDLALWEKRTDALLILLRKQGVLTVDAHRRIIESYGEQEYDRTTYYEKWIRAVRNVLVEQEVLSRAEIEARTADVRARHTKAGRKVAKETVPW
jgi:nitrile hydratase subunit beta